MAVGRPGSSALSQSHAPMRPRPVRSLRERGHLLRNEPSPAGTTYPGQHVPVASTFPRRGRSPSVTHYVSGAVRPALLLGIRRRIGLLTCCVVNSRSAVRICVSAPARLPVQNRPVGPRLSWPASATNAEDLLTGRILCGHLPASGARRAWPRSRGSSAESPSLAVSDAAGARERRRGDRCPRF
jgi:hypothetical protein